MLNIRLDVSVVPLYVTLDDKSYRDGLDLTPEGIYRFFAETRRTPRTSAVSVWDFLQVMTPLAAEGREILETTAGCVITSHCGESTLGVLYMELP
jgi:fatty acid-binding protein DegV